MGSPRDATNDEINDSRSSHSKSPTLREARELSVNFSADATPRDRYDRPKKIILYVEIFFAQRVFFFFFNIHLMRGCEIGF